jgi:predicted RNase H-like nuclease (RuvC/YqgF family)
MKDPEIIKLQYHNERLKELVDRLEWEIKALYKQIEELKRETARST